MADPGENHFERELGGRLLASVSRSFYLTLKALPAELREPVSLAYLLARTADTIADTTSAPAEIRLQCLRQFASLAEGDPDATRAEWTRRLAGEFAPCQTDPAESRLMERAGQALDWLASIDDTTRAAVRHVLLRIISGQILDIERFPTNGMVRPLADGGELEDYCWRVAGCVGEFWTRLCFQKLPGAIDPGVTQEAMIEDGVSLGHALQLVNILRDIGKDWALGRCYLPAENLFPADAAASWSTTTSPPESVLRPAWNHWLATAELRLEGGRRYVKNLRHHRLRYATALPLLLAEETLARLREADWPALLRGVKISRLDVARILAAGLRY